MKTASWTTWFFWIGIIIVLGTHIYMALYGLPPEQMFGHAILNIIAGLCILVAWKKTK